MGATGLLKDKNMKDMPTVPKKGTQVVTFDDSTDTNRTTALPGNICFVRATEDVWITRGGAAVTGTITPGDDTFFVGANDGWWDYNLPSGENYIAAIATSGGSGTLYVLETSDVIN
jgi:hypothetical protein